MAKTMGIYGANFPKLGKLVEYSIRSTLNPISKLRSYVTLHDRNGKQSASSFRSKLQKGKPLYLLGICAGGHNTGVSLVRCTRDEGIEIICNHEEERFTGTKHCTSFPERSIQELENNMHELGISSEDIHSFLGTWDYPAFAAFSMGAIASELPRSWSWIKPSMHEGITDSRPLYAAIWNGAKRLNTSLNTDNQKPIIGLAHHDCHAYYSYAASPFSESEKPTMVLVIDGSGDQSAISMFLGQGPALKPIYSNKSFFDSLGHLYSIMSSSLGGWTPLSSEGRYMGAAAWGQQCRLTNPFYKELRQILFFAPQGEVYLNRKLANWHLKGFLEPFSPALERIIGPSIPEHLKWNPDAILDVDKISHETINSDRVDKAAALQMVFEDALFHIIDHFIKSTGSEDLVITGGCALNCLANMHLLEHFNEEYFQRYLKRAGAFLKLWVPPNPGDAGTPIGAAYAFALQNQCPAGPNLQHAFYCGQGPKDRDINQLKHTHPKIAWISSMEICGHSDELPVADLIAYLITENMVLAIIQGPGETGPRALGHRSILANPCNPNIRTLLNERVKFRERIRPLAPMMTLAAAEKYFFLQKGASSKHYNAYNYMVLTAKAKLLAKQKAPAIIHYDGTSRIQIVRSKQDPFTHHILKQMNHWNGMEMLINTSFNVGSPIVQTLEQAVSTLQRSKGIDALICRTDSGQVWLAYDKQRSEIKDSGSKLCKLIRLWRYHKLDLNKYAIKSKV
ncbi:MAG: carbamoyltransferase C-terminal domain-containing protein [Oligoflexales bacterium]